MVKIITSLDIMSKRTKVNIGCGKDIKKGWINIDIAQLKGVDIIMDLENERIPLEDNTVELVYASHFLEHIMNLKHLLTEVARILKTNGIFKIIVPAYNSIGAFQDPTHKRFFTYKSFKYFTGQYIDYYYDDVKFKVVKFEKKRTWLYKRMFKFFYPLIKIIGKKKFDNAVDHLFNNMTLVYRVEMQKQ